MVLVPTDILEIILQMVGLRLGNVRQFVYVHIRDDNQKNQGRIQHSDSPVLKIFMKDFHSLMLQGIKPIHESLRTVIRGEGGKKEQS